MASELRSHFIDPVVGAYAVEHSSPRDPLQRELVEVTRATAGPAAGMQLGQDQAVLLEILARSLGARSAIELGTFTGYSSLAIVRGMGPEGRLLCCDASEEWTALAREFWKRAGVEQQVELRLGPAIETLRSLEAGRRFDLAFVDADKGGYADYYEEIVPRLRRGGLLVADNTLQDGRVADEQHQDESAVGIRRFNDRAVSDERVRVVVLPVGDGISIIQRL
jgi:caffeoyl-CoA O-methyltransferase